MTQATKTGGGAATASGMDYQSRVAAFIAAAILRGGQTGLEWLPDSAIEYLRIESPEPMGDLNIGLASGARVFCEAKRHLEFSERLDSKFAGVIRQFVSQYLRRCDQLQPDAAPTWDNTRLLLITGPASSRRLREKLKQVLQRARDADADAYFRSDAPLSDLRDVLTEHMRRSWKAVSAELPSREQIWQLTRVVDVVELDVERNGANEGQAKEILGPLLSEPSDAISAWDALLVVCLEGGKTRSNFTSSGLRTRLRERGFLVPSAPEYQSDIDAVRSYAQRSSDILQLNSRIKTSTGETWAEREASIELTEKAAAGHVVVVGNPGIGKSGLLSHFCNQEFRKKTDLLLLSADRIESTSLPGLDRELGLQHKLEEVLANWDGDHTAYVVIDALDAARGDAAAQMLRDLIARLRHSSLERWHLVVSVRRFDLEHSPELRSLFGMPGASQTPSTPTLQGIAHVLVPVLTPGELTQITSKSAALQTAISEVTSELGELLLVPFNLRLLAEIIDCGVTTVETSGIRTQLELLNLYWTWRVGTAGAAGREQLLKRICESMIEMQSLRVPSDDLKREGNDEALIELLKANVIRQWEGPSPFENTGLRLAFSHLILFDYATARLVMSEATAVSARLSSRPADIMMLRPALHFFFQQRWHRDADKAQFWTEARSLIETTGVPRVAALAAPIVAAVEARHAEELYSGDFGDESQLLLVRYTAGALLARWSECRERCDLWSEWLRQLGELRRLDVAFSVRPVFHELTNSVPDLSAKGLADLSQASRDLLSLAWDSGERGSALVPLALRCVARTASGSPAESAQILERCIAPKRLELHGHIEVRVLAREISPLLVVPDLVERIYGAAFGYRQTSTETTALGDSRILPLTSTVAQDYSQALWALTKSYSGFLRAAPIQAVRAMLVAIDCHVRREHMSTVERATQQQLKFDGLDAILTRDYSSIWDRRSSRFGQAAKLLDDLEEYLAELANDTSKDAALREVLVTIVGGNRWAVIWRRLLRAGTNAPESLGPHLKSLAWSPVVLSAYDTTQPAGEFIRAVHPVLDQADRQQIELAIISLASDETPEHIQSTRNRLLGCLDEAQLVTNEAATLMRRNREAKATPPNLANRSRVWSEPYGERDFLKDQGVGVDDPANLEIQRLGAQVESRTVGTTPGELAIPEIINAMPAMRALTTALLEPNGSDIHPAQRTYGCGILATACTVVARNDKIERHSEIAKFVVATLNELADYEVPEARPDINADFDRSPSWSKPAPRIDAAEGIVLLARFAPLLETIGPSLDRLSKDAHNAVRFQIATRLLNLFRSDPDRMWALLEQFCLRDSSPTVTAAVIRDALRRLTLLHPQRVGELVSAAWERLWRADNSTMLREAAARVIASLHVHRPSDDVGRLLERWTSQPYDYRAELRHIVFLLRDEMLGSDQDDGHAGVRRDRAFATLLSVVQGSHSQLNRLNEKYKGGPSRAWEDADQERAKDLLALCDDVAMQVYFASGAFDDHRKPEERIQDSARRRLYEKSGPLFDALANIGHASIAHHLVETLAHVSDIDPAGVLIRLADIVQKATAGLYQFESLGASLVVRVVQQYLAEHRSVLRDQPRVQDALLNLLDIFVEAGWPAAYQLTFRLEEIYR